MDVLELVKAVRFFKKGFKRLLSPKELRRLRESSEYYTINPDVEGIDYLHTDDEISSVDNEANSSKTYRQNLVMEDLTEKIDVTLVPSMIDKKVRKGTEITEVEIKSKGNGRPRKNKSKIGAKLPNENLRRLQ